MKFLSLIAKLKNTVWSHVREFLGLQPGHSADLKSSATGPAPIASKPLTPSNVVHLPTRPTVRVIRVSEPGLTQGSAGRMVMSGRFADVCDELNRLAA
jgi:hypothetical protein